MPPLLSLLLQAAPASSDAHGITLSPAAAIGGVVIFLFTQIGNLEKLWNWITGRAKDREDAFAKRLTDMEEAIGMFVDKDALEKRFAANEEKGRLLASEHANLLNIQHEKQRAHDNLAYEVGEQHKKLAAFDLIPPRVADLESKFNLISEQMRGMKENQGEIKNDIKDMKREMKEENKEILQAIRGNNRP